MSTSNYTHNFAFPFVPEQEPWGPVDVESLANDLADFEQTVRDYYLPTMHEINKESCQSKLDVLQHSLDETKDKYSSRPTKPRALKKNKAKRKAYEKRWGVVADRIQKLKDEIQMVQTSMNKPSTAELWLCALDEMRNAIYHDNGMHGVAGIHYSVVFKIYERMMAELSAKSVPNPEWEKTFVYWKTKSKDATSDDIKTAFAFLSVTSRMLLFPHQINWDQVSDNLSFEQGVMVPHSGFFIENKASNFAREHQNQALACNQITNPPFICGKAINIAEHVDILLSDLRSGLIKNAYLSAPMGGVYQVTIDGKAYNSGSKTGGVMLPLILDAIRSEKQVTIIVHRVSLTRDLFQRILKEVDKQLGRACGYTVRHYHDRGFEDARTLVTCMNSLEREDIKAYLAESDLVIIDEFSQTMDNFALIESRDPHNAAKTEANLRKAFAINDAIMTAIASTNVTFVAMDADLERTSLETIINQTESASMTGVYAILHPENQLEPHKRSRKVIFHRNRMQRKPIARHIDVLCQRRLKSKNSGSNADRFCIATDSRALTYTYEQICRSAGLSVCVVNSDTREANSSDASLLMNHEVQPDKFDVVILSPTITSGCSWTTPAFKTCVVIACGVIPSSNIKQMAFRFRHTNHIDVFQYQRAENDMQPVTEYNSEKAQQICDEYQYSSLLVDLRTQRSQVAIRSVQNQLSFLFWQFDAEGWGCSANDIAMNSIHNVDNDLDNCPTTNQSVRTKMIMDGRLIQIKEYLSLNRQADTHDDVLACLRWKASVYDAVSLDEGNVSFALSSSYGKTINPMMSEVLGDRPTESGLLADAIMTEIVGGDWRKELQNGTEFSVNSDTAERLVHSLIDTPNQRHLMHRGNIFTTVRNWIPKDGRMRENATVITCIRHHGSRQNAWNTIKANLDERDEYVMHWLQDASILIVKVIKKDNKNRKSLGLSIIRKVLKRCGINFKSNRDGVIIGGNNQALQMAMAERKMLSMYISGQIKQAVNLHSVALDCWNSERFIVEFTADGASVKIVGSTQFIAQVLESDILAVTGYVLDRQVPLENADELCNLAGKKTSASVMPHSSLCSLIQSDGFDADSSIELAELTLKNQLLDHETSSKKLLFSELFAPKPTCADLCRAFLTILATSNERVSMLRNGLKVNAAFKPDLSVSTDLIQQAANSEREYDIYKYVDD